MYDAIFLDCDGVVTDKKARVDKRVLFEVYRLAHAGKNIAFITGRSLTWLSHNIVPVIEHFNPSPEDKAKLFFIGEYGNRWLFFSGIGFMHGADNSNSLPVNVRAKIRNEIARFPLLFFDETKESFVSLEVRHDALISPSMEAEANRQLDIAAGYFSTRYPEFNVVRTLYAIDILPKGLDKASGIKRALELAGGVVEVLVLGDSPADLLMGEELMNQGVKFKFYYLGEQPVPPALFEVKKPSSRYAEGAHEVLSGIR